MSHSPAAASSLFHIDALLPPERVAQLERQLETTTQEQKLGVGSSGCSKRDATIHAHAEELDAFLRTNDHVQAALTACVASSAAASAERASALASAQCHKQHGNACFARGAYGEAVSSYSLALRLAWADRSLTAVCFTNRATSLQRLSLLEHALADCQRALELDEAYDKAWARLAHVQLARGCVTQSLEAATRVRVATPAMDKCVADAQAAIAQNGATSARPASLLSVASQPPVSHEHPQLACASASVSLHRSAAAGRFLVAQSPLEMGECVISERAFAAVLRNAFRPRPLDVRAPPSHALPANMQRWRCEACFKPLQAVQPPSSAQAKSPAALWFVPCPSCPAALYCSPACLYEDALEAHSLECGLHPLLQRLPEVTRLALRMAVAQARNERQCGQSDKLGGAAAVDALQTHMDEIPPRALVEYELQAAIVRALMGQLHSQHHGCGPAHSGSLLPTAAAPATAEGSCWHETITFQRLLRHLCQTRTNVYAITEIAREGSGAPLSTAAAAAASASRTGMLPRLEQLRVATGVFPTAALLNHACAPNVALNFGGRHLRVLASAPLSAGTEVLNNYGPHRGHHSRAERQHALQEQYFFTCTCDACQQREDEEVADFRCTHSGCSGALRPSASASGERVPSSGMPSRSLRCSVCGRVAEEQVLVEQQHELEDALKEAQADLDHGEASRAFALSQAVLHRQQQLHPPSHPLLAATFHLQASCMAHAGRLADCVQLLQRTLPILRAQFGSGSIEMAHECATVAIMQARAGDGASAAASAASVLPVLRLHHASGSSLVQELEAMLRTPPTPAS